MLIPSVLAQELVVDSAAVIFTALRATIVTLLSAPNLDTSAATLQLWQGASAVDGTCILPPTTIPAGGRLEGGGIVLDAGNKLYAESGTDEVITLTLYGLEFVEQGPIPPSAHGFKVTDSSGREAIVQTAAVANLDDVGDVVLTDIQDGDMIVYDTDSFVNVPAELSSLADATITTPADGDVLVYDTTAFVNKSMEVAGLSKWLGVDAGPVTDPPTPTELSSALGDPAVTGPAFGIVSGTTTIYLCVTDGTDWYYSTTVKSVAGA